MAFFTFEGWLGCARRYVARPKIFEMTEGLLHLASCLPRFRFFFLVKSFRSTNATTRWELKPRRRTPFSVGLRCFGGVRC